MMENYSELERKLKNLQDKYCEEREELLLLLERCRVLDEMPRSSVNDDSTILTSCLNHFEEKVKKIECQNLNATFGGKFDDIISAFKTFKGDNTTKVFSWISHFENQSNEFKFSDIQKFILTKRLMKDSARLFLNFESVATSWTMLKRELIQEFNTKINSSIVHQKVIKRKKKEKE